MSIDCNGSISVVLKSEIIIEKIGIKKLRKLEENGKLSGYYYNEDPKKCGADYFGIDIYDINIMDSQAEKLELDKLNKDILEAKKKFYDLIGLEGDIYLIGHASY